METLGPPPQELLFLAPQILLAVAGLALLLLGAHGRGLSGREAALVAGASLLLAGGLVVRVQAALEGRDSLALLGGLFVLDGVSFLVQLLVLLAALVTVLLTVPARRSVAEGRGRAARFPALLLLGAAVLLLLASGAGLPVLWLALLAGSLAAGLALRIAPVHSRAWRQAGARMPTPVAAFLAAALPAAAFALLLRVLHLGLGSAGVRWQPAAAALAAGGLIGGSLVALTRVHGRGLLAAGSLAHAGALLTALLVAGGTGLPAALFYLLSGTTALLGAFSAEALRERRGPAGPASVPPAATLLFLLALAGLPLTGGFAGKIGLLAAALRTWPWLAVTAAVASALALAAALRRLAPRDRGDAAWTAAATPRHPAATAAVVLCAALVLALGLVPGPVLAWTQSLRWAAGK